MNMPLQSGIGNTDRKGGALLGAILLSPLLLAILSGHTAADMAENRTAFNNHCRMCHSFKPGDNRLGPTMYGIFGAKAGRVAGYAGYSGGLSGLVWDEVTLDRFIADPASISPSTNMIYPPVTNPVERKKIIRFLKSLNRKS